MRTRVNLNKVIGTTLAALLIASSLGTSLAEANIWKERTKSISSHASPLSSKQPHQNMYAMLPQGMMGVAKGNMSSGPSWVSSLPSRFGDVQKESLSQVKNSAPFVVLVQDLHDVYEAQLNVANILKHFQNTIVKDQNKKVLFGLEGGSGRLKLDPFRQFPQREHHLFTTQFLLNRRIISGPEYFALTSTQEPWMYGVETPSYYRENVKAFQEGEKIKDRAQQQLKSIKASLSQVKNRIFTKPLWDLDNVIQKYHDGELDVIQYIKTLGQYASVGDSLPEINKTMGVLNLETSLNFEQVEKERISLLRLLTEKLTTESQNQLLQRSLAVRSGLITSAQFYSDLESLCQTYNISLQSYSMFLKYKNYVVMAEALDHHRLFEELNILKDRVMNTTSSTAEQNALLQISDDLALADRLIDQAFGPVEWKSYITRREGLFQLRQRLSNLLPPEELKNIPDASSLKGRLLPFERFYQAAEKRNEALVTNLLQEAKRGNANCMVLLAGGFHTRGLEALFKNKGIASITVTPKVTHVPAASQYLDAFTMRHIPLEKMLMGEKLFLPLELGLSESVLAMPARHHNVRAGYVTTAGVLAASTPTETDNNWVAELASRLHISPRQIEVTTEGAFALAEVNGTDMQFVVYDKLNDRGNNLKPFLSRHGLSRNPASEDFSYDSLVLVAVKKASRASVIGSVSKKLTDVIDQILQRLTQDQILLAGALIVAASFYPLILKVTKNSQLSSLVILMFIFIIGATAIYARNLGLLPSLATGQISSLPQAWAMLCNSIEGETGPGTSVQSIGAAPLVATEADYRTGFTVPEGQDPFFVTMTFAHYNVGNLFRAQYRQVPDILVNTIRETLQGQVKKGLIKAAIVHDMGGYDLKIQINHNYGEGNASVHRLMMEAVKEGLQVAQKRALLKVNVKKISLEELAQRLSVVPGEHSFVERASESVVIAQGINVGIGAVNIKLLHQFGILGSTPLQKLGVTKSPGFRFRVKRTADIMRGITDGAEWEFELSADQFARYKKDDPEVKFGAKKEGEPKTDAKGNWILTRQGRNEGIWLLALASQTNDYAITAVYSVEGSAIPSEEPIVTVIYQPIFNTEGQRVLNPTMIYRSQSGADAVGGIQNMVLDVNFVPGGEKGEYFVATSPMTLEQARKRVPSAATNGLGYFVMYGYQSEKAGALPGGQYFDIVARNPESFVPYQKLARDIGKVMASHGDAQPHLAPFAAEEKAEKLREEQDSLFITAPKESEIDPFLEPLQKRMKEERWVRVADDKADMGGDLGHEGVPVYMLAVYFATLQEAREQGIGNLIPKGSISDAVTFGLTSTPNRFLINENRGVGDDGHIIMLGDNDIYSKVSHQLAFLAFTRAYHYAVATGKKPYGLGQDYQGPEAKKAKKQPIQYSQYTPRYFQLLSQYLPTEFVEAEDVQAVEKAWKSGQESDELPEPFSGNVTQQGIGSAGYSFDPKVERTFDILAGDKMGPPAFNLLMQEAIYDAAQSKMFENGLVYEIWDLKAFPPGVNPENATSEQLKEIPTKRIFLDAFQDREAVKKYLADSDRFNVRNVWSKSSSKWDIRNPQKYLDRVLLSSSVTRLGILTGGEYVGKDDPLIIGNSILMGFIHKFLRTRPLIVQGDMNGSHWEWAVVSKLDHAVATIRSHPILTALRYRVSEDGSILTGVEDIFAQPEFNAIRKKAHEFNMLFDRAQLGQNEPHGANRRTVEGSYELAKILRDVNLPNSPFLIQNRMKWDMERKYPVPSAHKLKKVYQEALKDRPIAALEIYENIGLGFIFAVFGGIYLFKILGFGLDLSFGEIISGMVLGTLPVIAFHEAGHRVFMGPVAKWVSIPGKLIGFEKSDGSRLTHPEALAGPLSLLVSVPVLIAFLLPTFGMSAALGAVLVALGINITTLFIGEDAKHIWNRFESDVNRTPLPELLPPVSIQLGDLRLTQKEISELVLRGSTKDALQAVLLANSAARQDQTLKSFSRSTREEFLNRQPDLSGFARWKLNRKLRRLSVEAAAIRSTDPLRSNTVRIVLVEEVETLKNLLKQISTSQPNLERSALSVVVTKALAEDNASLLDQLQALSILRGVSVSFAEATAESQLLIRIKPLVDEATRSTFFPSTVQLVTSPASLAEFDVTDLPQNLIIERLFLLLNGMAVVSVTESLVQQIHGILRALISA